VTDDRQTDHATEKCVAVGKIAYAARNDFDKKILQHNGLYTNSSASVKLLKQTNKQQYF